jgi:hypothetical protein
MEDKQFNDFNIKIAYIVVLQVVDKVLTKEITQADMNVIMNNMLNKELDFIFVSGTFINKKAVYFLEFQPITSVKKAEEN